VISIAAGENHPNRLRSGDAAIFGNAEHAALIGEGQARYC